MKKTLIIIYKVVHDRYLLDTKQGTHSWEHIKQGINWSYSFSCLTSLLHNIKHSGYCEVKIITNSSLQVSTELSTKLGGPDKTTSKRKGEFECHIHTQYANYNRSRNILEVLGLQNLHKLKLCKLGIKTFTY